MTWHTGERVWGLLWLTGSWTFVYNQKVFITCQQTTPLNPQLSSKTDPSWPPFKRGYSQSLGSLHYEKCSETPAKRHFSCTPLIPKTKCFITNVTQNKLACNTPASGKQVCVLTLTALPGWVTWGTASSVAWGRFCLLHRRWPEGCLCERTAHGKELYRLDNSRVRVQCSDTKPCFA